MKRSEIVRLAVYNHLVVKRRWCTNTSSTFLCNAVALTHGYYSSRAAYEAGCPPLCSIINDINLEIDGCYTMYHYLEKLGIACPTEEECYNARIKLANKLLEKYKIEESLLKGDK